MDLHILDCSEYIYQGAWAGKARGNNRYNNTNIIARGVRESNGKYGPRQAPIGGAKFLIKEAAKLVDSSSKVVCVFDRFPQYKREMYGRLFGDEDGYKGTRDRTTSDGIYLEKDFAEECMNKLGFNCLAADCFEADDVIYTLVSTYKGSYDNIIVHTRDSDLFFLVNGNVTIAPTGQLGKHISVQNYEISVVTDKIIPYNSIGFHKLIYGDTSDNIPGIGVEWKSYFKDKLDRTICSKLGNLDFARSVLMDMVNECSMCTGVHKWIPTFDILNPLEVPVNSVELWESDINKTAIEDYFLGGLNPSIDKWGFEEILDNYIDRYGELEVG